MPTELCRKCMELHFLRGLELIEKLTWEPMIENLIVKRFLALSLCAE